MQQRTHWNIHHWDEKILSARRKDGDTNCIWGIQV
jgi:hypothetical protein